MANGDSPDGKGFASRKFLLSVLTVLVASTLVYFGKLDGVAWTGAVAVAVGGYVAANVFQSVGLK